MAHSLFRFLNQGPKVNFHCLGDSQQHIERRPHQPVLDAGHRRMRNARTFRDGIHGEPQRDALFSELTRDRGANDIGFGFTHAISVPQKELDSLCAYMHILDADGWTRSA